MKVEDASLSGVKIFTPEIYEDDRGYFFESFRSTWVPEYEFVQENQSRSISKTLRGLHYQFDKPQGKLVRVVKGEIFDVAVDLRKSSKTFGKWFGKTLSFSDKEIIWIPPGLAHGFLVLSSEAEVIYQCTEFYRPSGEKTIKWDDKDLAISWPLFEETPKLSKKDASGLSFREAPHFS